MRKRPIFLVAVSIFTAASIATAAAQVTGIRHSDGSWTFVDAHGRDIHKDDDAGRTGRRGDRGIGHGAAKASRHVSARQGESHRTSGYLPWLSR
jgi:hypothetical protein